MKVLITSIIDLKKGAPSRLHWFIRQLTNKHQVTVVCINDWWKSQRPDSHLYNEGFELGDYRLLYLTERRLSPIWQETTSAMPTSRWLKEIARSGFDVHFNYNTLISGYVAARKLKSLGVGTVYDLADDLPKMVGNSPQLPAPLRKPGQSAARFMMAKSIKIADKVSVATVELSHLCRVPESKSVMIPNGVDTEMFRPHNVESLKQELGLEGCFVIGFVGALREWVDLRPVFLALKRLRETNPNLRMLVVGGEVGITETRELAADCGVSDLVKFTGTVPYLRVADYTCCMDICVMPLKFDNAQPLSCLQYLACSKPVIATRPLRISPEVVLYAADDVEYEQRIKHLIKEPSLRESLGLHGREFVEQNHRWAKLAGDLETVLLDTAGLSRRKK